MTSREPILVQKLRQAMSVGGLGGAIKTVSAKLWQQVSFAETHIWYELDLTQGAPPVRALGDGLTLRTADDPDADLLVQLPTVVPAEARRRMAAGNDLWIVLEGQQLLFSCWIFHDRTPTVAAAGGEFELPADTVCLEDSIAAPAARGRGIAPATWTAIAGVVSQDGRRRIVTKVTIENTPSRRAVEKAGFEEIGMMSFKRLGFRSRTQIEPLDARAGFLVDGLDGRSWTDSPLNRASSRAPG
jgi:RimJ/RimL family protein N-acetyltransferase